ncbi:monosaccharide-sensing protein 2-like [Dorcoceras hygrometricum]|uniref:Monosaccharide-sensing protein 2-like n=1 Tax=Dorcoceras hygrometricum TaxID=472368 RepID=A0A2Z7AFV6_9LAMI|nr:monosaccharide-sensing protein 2-like [Dorcoceras hygrometricum]
MSLFDLQDVCIAIGSVATLDLPMVVDLIGIYGLKGSYCMLTTTNWFFQALSVIPRGSWGDVARRSYHDPMGKSGIVIPEPQWCGPTASCIPEPLRVPQADEGVSLPIVDLIDESTATYREEPVDTRFLGTFACNNCCTESIRYGSELDVAGNWRNPGFTAGHSFNPAGGAPGGG